MSNDIYDFLEQMLDEEETAADTENVPDIMSAAEAERTLWYYKKLQLEVAEMKQQAEDYVKEAQRTADRFLSKNCTRKEEYLSAIEQRLRNFTEAELTRTGKKSLKLINGTMSFVKQQPKYERDEEAILTYINATADDNNPLAQFLKPQPAKLDWAGLKKAGTIKEIDGVKRLVVDEVMVPTVTIVDQDKAFKIK